MIDTKAANYQGLYDSRIAAEDAALALQAAGRETKIIESILHKGQYVLYCVPKNSELQS